MKTSKINKQKCILSILLIIGIAESCIICPECNPVYMDYTISSLTLLNVDCYDQKRVNSFGEDENRPIDKIHYGIKMVFNTRDIYAAICEPTNSLFIQSAYACDCSPDEFYPQESIISINIFSDKNFGETHKAGTDISDLFGIMVWQEKEQVPPFPVEWGWALIPFADYLERIVPTWYLAIDNHGNRFFDFTCLMVSPPSEAGEYEFTVVVILSDERILEQSIKAILE